MRTRAESIAAKLPAPLRAFAARHRETLLAALTLFLLINLTLAPFIVGDRTLQPSAIVGSLYTTGAESPAPVVQYWLHQLDPAAGSQQLEPWMVLERDLVLGEHSPPVWNPYSAYGVPLAANMQSQPYSPFAWVTWLFPGAWGLGVFALLRLFVGALFTYLLLRQFVAWGPALAGGVAALYAGYAWLYLLHPELSAEAFTPALLYGIERVLRGPGFRPTVLLAAATAFSVLGGSPESSLLMLGFAGAYAAYRLLRGPQERAQARHVLPLLSAAALLGFGLSAIQTIPFLEYVPLSFNKHTKEPWGTLADPWSVRYLAVYLAPLLHGPTWGGPNWSIPGSPGWTGIRGFFGATGCYLALVAVLARIDARGARRHANDPTAFFALAVLFFIVKRFGFPLVNWVGLLPGLRAVQFSKYDETLVALCVAVLTGLGVARITDARTRGRVPFAAAVVVFGLLTTALVSDQAWLRSAGPDGIYFVYALACATTFFALVAMTAWATGTKQLAPAIATVAATVLIAAEAHASFIVPLYYVMDPNAPRTASPVLGAPYVTALKGMLANGARFYGEDDLLVPEWSAAFAVPDVRGLDALYPSRYLTFVRAFLPDSPQQELTTRFRGGRGITFADPHERRFLALSSVRYVGANPSEGLDRVHPAKPGAPAPFRLAYADPNAALYEFHDTLPRMAVFGRVRRVADGETALRTLADPAFDPFTEAVVEGGGQDLTALAAGPATPAAAATIEVQTSRYTRASVEPAASALVLLTDSAYPGWRARVDGAIVPIVTANYLFRGVVVRPGKHVVEFSYEPASFEVGAAVTLFSLAAVVGWGLWRRQALPRRST